MNRILITGVNSYIGNNFEEWISQWPDQYTVTKISLRNDEWKTMDWSKIDIVLNVAGIAHRKESKYNKKLYEKINKNLAIELAKKAKQEGVGHFIQLSTMSVFGLSTGNIIKDTNLNPINNY